MDELSTIRVYHEATKHYPGRYARSRGYLDWDTQPDPFRRYAGAPVLRLALPQRAPQPLYDDLFEAGRVPPRALDRDALSQFLGFSLAISAWKQAGGVRWALRCNPSSGNLHPTEGYAILPAIPGLCSEPGVFHYAPQVHGLEQRRRLGGVELMDGLPRGAFVVGLSSVLWREAWKYGERAYRYCQHDVGHALAALRLAAAALGWRMYLLHDLGDDDVARLFGLDRAGDFPPAEREEPELAALVLTGGAASSPASDVRALLRGAAQALVRMAEGTPQQPWIGIARPLSPDHVRWELIEEVAEAARKPRTASLAHTAPGDPEPAPAPPCAAPATKSVAARSHSAWQIFHQRRSAVALDAATPLSCDAFCNMLARVVVDATTPRPPFDVIPWPPCIHLVLFVHLVEGLAPGVYVLVRNAAAVESLRSELSPDFEWARPPGVPERLPLWRLLTADCRSAAADLSLGQAIASDGAFSLGMLAEFDSALQREGAWFYRRLFWEAGMIGQVLYLEAEAAGVRATGIGAYFDDWVHETIGLGGAAFQSLYHFTVGGPVDDPRITTLPAYA